MKYMLEKKSDSAAFVPTTDNPALPLCITVNGIV